MANVLLIGVDLSLTAQITRALAVERHRVKQKPRIIGVRDLIDADIVFVGGEPSQYLSVLRLVRHELPDFPIVVVTRIPETTAWLEALEAGATDYCSSPIESRQIHWLMESASPQYQIAAA